MLARNDWLSRWALVFIGISPAFAWAGGLPVVQLDPVIVIANQDSLIGQTPSASVGTVYSDQFENRPLSRPGELLETVPGLIVTQHSGEGKANQYFLRGFNLDHGTDFATFIDGMPVNMPTHAHGQGYSDNNPLFPELVESIEYRKGPYYADFGDFSAAGAVRVRYKDEIESPFIQATGGLYGYQRLIGAASGKLGAGTLLWGAEVEHYDGPFVLDDRYNKVNAVVRYSNTDANGAFHLDLLAYNASWTSTDQIPKRAVDDGMISRLGYIDPSDGGKSSRYSLIGNWNRNLGTGELIGNAYLSRYDLGLFSNFTYFLNNPVRGDQMEQYDRRTLGGGSLAYRLKQEIAGINTQSEIGVQDRYDNIPSVALYRTEARQRYFTVSDDKVRQNSGAIYAQSEIQILPWLRALGGLRFDIYNFDVTSNTPANSGNTSDHQTSPKLTLVFGPFQKSEFFINYGEGFHSNDARGTTETIDPNDGVTPVQKVNALVAARGIDLGMRSALIPKTQIAFSLFALDLDSELTFSGDDGTTEPNRPSRREGTELSVYWRPIPRLVVDSDIAFTRSRFRDNNPIGDHIPEAATSVAALGLSYESAKGWDAALRLRYFGPRPLIEDNSQRSNATRLVNLHLGYHFSPQLALSAEFLNLFNSHDDDIRYYYTSRLPSEPAGGVNDQHFHPVEPFTARLVLTYRFTDIGHSM